MMKDGKCLILCKCVCVWPEMFAFLLCKVYLCKVWKVYNPIFKLKCIEVLVDNCNKNITTIKWQTLIGIVAKPRWHIADTQSGYWICPIGVKLSSIVSNESNQIDSIIWFDQL